MIRRGNGLQVQGKLDEAMALYQAVLADSPDCVAAIEEVANVHLSKGDFAKAIEVATQGLAYSGNGVSSLYITIGSAYDDTGNAAKAIEAYQAGIAADPNGLLYFNLALTLQRQGHDTDALDNLKHAAMLTPNHASTHLVMASLFARHGYLSQGLMALSRFLMLEPGSSRTGDAYRMWLSGWQGGVTIGADGKVNAQVRVPPDSAEGDFLQMDVAVGASRGAVLATASGKPAAQLLVEQLNYWMLLLAKDDKPADRSAFAWRYYAPFFAEVYRRGYVEPLAYWVSQRTNLPGVQEWIADAANRQRATEFMQWAQQYPWPKD